MDWGNRYIKLRLLLGGSIVIVLGLIIYFVKHFTPVLVLPVIGVAVIAVGVLYKPKPINATVIENVTD